MECSCGHPSEVHEEDGCRFMLEDGSYPCKCTNSMDRSPKTIKAVEDFLRKLGQ